MRKSHGCTRNAAQKFTGIGSVCTLSLAGFITGILTAHAAPEHQPFVIPDANPTSYSEIERVMSWGSSSASSDPDAIIKDNLEEAICGGWDIDDTVGNQIGPPGKVAKTQGLPGREPVGGNPLTQLDLGMAERDDAFQYPDTSDTCGFFAACVPFDWPGPQPGRARGLPEINGVPHDHLCQRPLDGWRVDTNDSGDRIKPAPQRFIDKGLQYSCGNGSMNGAEGRFCAELNDRGKFGGLCAVMNEFQYNLFQKPIFADQDAVDADGNDIVITVQIGWKRRKGGCFSFRSDKDVDARNDEISDMSDQGYDDIHSTRYCCTDDEVGGAFENCLPCNGEECREGREIPTIITSNVWRYCYDSGRNRRYADGGAARCDTSEPLNGAGTSEYVSYFRHYIGEFERSPLDSAVVPNDDFKRDNVPVSCFGLWWEFDPKDFILPHRYWRCVISIYYRGGPYRDKWFKIDDQRKEDNSNLIDDDMLFSQEGKGDYKIDPPPDDPAVEDDVRKFYDGGAYEDFDEDKHAWFMELGDAYALMNSKVIDLTDALLNVDTARQRTTVQESLDKILSSGALIRGFDDSVNNVNFKRVFTEWWQKTQTEASKLRGIKVKLLLPPTWSIGLDPLQPLVTPPELDTTTNPDYRKNPKQQPVEVLLELREDLLGDVQKYLEDSLILNQVQKEVPVVIPLGSASDFRARAHGWCTWWLKQQIEQGSTPSTAGCDSGPVGDLITKLNEYADRIEEARALRAELDTYAGHYLNMHKETSKKIAEWVLDNTGLYDQYLTNAEELDRLRDLWKEIVVAYHEFEDDINMPWCRNDRFTIPIYSFLDPWWPNVTDSSQSGPFADSVIPSTPRLFEETLFPELIIPDQRDVVIDMSKIIKSQTGVVLPVIRPIEVSIDWGGLNPPTGTFDQSMIPELPDLPPIPSFKDDIIANIPEVSTPPPQPPTFASLVPPIDITDIETQMEEIRYLLSGGDPTDPDSMGMVPTYEKFWDAMLIDPFVEEGGRFKIEDRAEEDCYQVGIVGTPFEDICVHSEFDLIERFTRLGSRPAVLLEEDMIKEGLGTFRRPEKDGITECANDDWACQMLNPQFTMPKTSWKITVPAEEMNDRLDGYKRQGFEETLERPGVSDDDQFPYVMEREDIAPSFDVPEDTVIIPLPGEEFPSSASSSSP